MERIDDYALIGDGRAAALVSRRGSIDWLCWPRFDSPSVFGRLLDDAAGRWSLCPAGAFQSTRRYLRDTNVLETRFVTDQGRLVVTDLMPIASEEEKRTLLLPEHELLRVARCEEGEVEVETRLDARPGFGSHATKVKPFGALGLRLECPRALLLFRSELPVEETGEDGALRGRARLHAGDEVALSLSYTRKQPAVIPLLGPWAQEAVDRSCRWWRDWVHSLQYDGPRRDAVIRSALVLRLLVYAPSGAIVAAPTTSLPEREGGDLNWDYRYCWLRDAALTTRALFGLGCAGEAEGFVHWLVHSTRLTRPELRILYDVYGRVPPRERTLGLAGYRGAQPVRVGNAAADQLQLDVYGEVIDAVAQLVRRGGRLDWEMQRTLLGWGDHVCRNWDRPDEGIWEPRSGRAHHTHSRLLCWVALDRLLELHALGRLPRAPVARFERARAQLADQLRTRGFSARQQSYVQRYDGEEVDASLLLLAWYGFEPAGSARMRSTYERIRRELGAPRGLLYRYRTGPPAQEGAFGICSFWAVDCLARGSGDPGQARELFEALCDLGNDVGLFAEQIDPESGRALGNFPQAFTHVGLINAALSVTGRFGAEPEATAVHTGAAP